jgi:hypothetical protein
LSVLHPSLSTIAPISKPPLIIPCSRSIHPTASCLSPFASYIRCLKISLQTLTLSFSSPNLAFIPATSKHPSMHLLKPETLGFPDSTAVFTDGSRSHFPLRKLNWRTTATHTMKHGRKSVRKD